jgi:hypothetical protein
VAGQGLDAEQELCAMNLFWGEHSTAWRSSAFLVSERQGAAAAGGDRGGSDGAAGKLIVPAVFARLMGSTSSTFDDVQGSPAEVSCIQWSSDDLGLPCLRKVTVPCKRGVKVSI